MSWTLSVAIAPSPTVAAAGGGTVAIATPTVMRSLGAFATAETAISAAARATPPGEPDEMIVITSATHTQTDIDAFLGAWMLAGAAAPVRIVPDYELITRHCAEPAAVVINAIDGSMTDESGVRWPARNREDFQTIFHTLHARDPFGTALYQRGKWQDDADYSSDVAEFAPTRIGEQELACLPLRGRSVALAHAQEPALQRDKVLLLRVGVGSVLAVILALISLTLLLS